MRNKMKTMLFVIIVLICGIIVGRESKETTKIKDINYDIVEKNDLSVGGAIRFSWEVVVKDEISVGELEDLAKEIVKEAKKEERFNAIVINFYDYEEYIGKGYTLGKAEYAPEGDWSKANTVNTGNYKTMDYSFDLREKDWSMQLTESDVEVFDAWMQVSKEQESEDEITKEVAEKFNITEEEVSNIMIKQMEWAFYNKNN